MSEHDSFIDEVTEEVRRDQLYAMFRKYGWIAIAGVVLLVGGAAVNEWMKARSEAEARAFGDAISLAIKDTDPSRRATDLAAIDPQGKTGREGILGLLVASQAQAAGDTATSVARLKAVAADTKLAPIYRQLAQMKMLMVAGADLPQADRDAILAEVTAPGAPYRPVALELQALSLLDAGQTDAAAALLGKIAQDAEATAAEKSRVNALLTALGKPPVESAAPADAAPATTDAAPTSTTAP